MTPEVKAVHDFWARTRAWCKKHYLKKNADVRVSAVDARSSNERLVSENAVLEAYAKGYQDGWNAGLPNRQDSAGPSRAEHGSATPNSVMHTTRGSLTPDDIEKRGFKAGWNKAWEIVKKDGWTQGCTHCSQHVRHANVVRRRSGVRAKGDFYGIPNSSSLRNGNRKQRAWSTTAVTGNKR